MSPREKVLKTLRIFKIVFEELARDKAARRGKSTATTSVHHKTRDVLLESGKQVNGTKMIGQVPGVHVGDEFQYKTEISLVGLHLSIVRGIDYMHKRDDVLATSIVASEGSGYCDRFDFDVLIYSGEGGNGIRKSQKILHDQKMVRGNLALVNSMRLKSPVRVIRGLKRSDYRGKHYVYDGLYVVQDYWEENGPGGNVIFKFKLCRCPGQPSVDWKHYF
ncbi:PREDICTED: YDG domain-containing protein At5g47160-like [Camelina sativa]|uniref:YDG domain-containing protein At5g47160-like n=1 Tax=Camelina sativa TaxID=90675 RepID=A0ABM0WP85_CAMSA|nr:PREDICTED: YDG domain-containing protein At5g47160-like [Camelina sativa]